MTRVDPAPRRYQRNVGKCPNESIRAGKARARSVEHEKLSAVLKVSTAYFYAADDEVARPSCLTRDSFAYAAGKEEGHWVGFAFGSAALVTLDQDLILISHDDALAHQRQLDEAEARRAAAVALAAGTTRDGSAMPATDISGSNLLPGAQTPGSGGKPTPVAPAPTRFFGTAQVNADTATIEFSTIVNEVIQHFSSQAGVDVTLTVEVEARTRNGFSVSLQRIVRENCASLAFRAADFERD